MTQAQYILMILKRDGQVTPLEAILECNCFRLDQRIKELQHEGHKIEVRTFTLPTGRAVPIYSLERQI